MTYKWETLKKKAILMAVGRWEGFFEKLAPYGMVGCVADRSFNWKKNTDELAGKVIKIIERWDVRRAKSMIDLFPGIVPKRFLGMVPKCYVADNEKADWMVEFREEPACSR